MGNLLTQNGELRQFGIHNWTLPALTARVRGKTVKVCPQAGACAKFCYALSGTYRFSNVKAAHTKKLEIVMYRTKKWRRHIIQELEARRFKPTGVPRLPDLPRDHLPAMVRGVLDSGGPIVRIHDSGDFFAAWYLAEWTSIALECPDVIFYAYTKEVTMVREHGPLPANFLICFSLGGKEDYLLDLSEGGDRHAEVFQSLAELEDAGYTDQDAHDLLCVVAPSTRVGIVANNIPAVNRKLDGRTFGEAELEIRPR